MTERTFPVKPGDWVTDGDYRIAKVKDVYFFDEYLVDLVMYNFEGQNLRRESPAMGGPTTYEPACSYVNWHRVQKPDFPIELGRVDRGGYSTLDYIFPDILEDRKWVRPPKKYTNTAKYGVDLIDVLKQIAEGHNDSRKLAQDTLKRKGYL